MLKLFRCHHTKMVCERGKNEKNVGNSIAEKGKTHDHTQTHANVRPKCHYHRSFSSKFASFACSIAWVMTFHLFASLTLEIRMRNKNRKTRIIWPFAKITFDIVVYFLRRPHKYHSRTNCFIATL